MTTEVDEQEMFDQAATAEAVEPTPEATEAEPAPEPVETEAPVEAQAETQAEAEPEPEPVTPEPEQAAEQASEEQDAEAETPKGGVPPHRLRETADRARKAEAEAEALQKRLDMLEATVLQQQRQQPPQPAAPAEEPQDFFADPEAYARTMEQKFNERLRQTEVDMSLRMAERTYGDEYKAAHDALMASNDSNAARAVLNAPDPGETLVQMHRRQKLLAETGGDLEGYRERLRAELLSDPDFLKSATEAARATAQTTTATGAPHLNIPQSVNSGTRSGDARPAAATTQSADEMFLDAVR